MEKALFLCVGLAAIVSIFPRVTTFHCGGEQQIRFARIPDYYSLLSLHEFESFIVDQTLGEMYLAILKPPAFEPDINYKSTISRSSDGSMYIQSTKGETRGDNSTCVRTINPLTPIGGLDKAFFILEDGSTVQAIWSNCPDKYVWSMRCGDYEFGKRRCMLNETILSVYINGDMDDVPMLDIVLDLYHGTGIRIGAEMFKWFFSFGENTLC